MIIPIKVNNLTSTAYKSGDISIVKAEDNWKEVVTKSVIVEASGNKSGDISIVKAEDNLKEVVAKSGIVEASGNKSGDISIAKAEDNWKEVVAKSGIVEASGNKSGDISIAKAEDNWKEVVAKSGIVEASGNKEIKPDESARCVEQGVGESKTVSETEKMLESMKELNKKLMEMTYKGKLTCEYDKKDMKSKNKSNDDDDDEEAVKGCMSWLL